MSDPDQLRAALKVFADMGTYDHPHGVTALAWFEAVMGARSVLQAGDHDTGKNGAANVVALPVERKPKFQGW